MRPKENILETIGETPLIRLNKIEHIFNTAAMLYAKVESLNPGGSIKDRPALKMIEKAERDGLIKKDSTVIEPTSGNTGIGLAMVCAVKGYKTILVMPETVSIERRLILEAYGARVVLTNGAEGMEGAVKTAKALSESIPGSFMPGQFTNPENPAANMKTTGPEIYRDLNGRIDAFVSGIGSGGTISGVGMFLKKKIPSIYIVGLEPASSPYLSAGIKGRHEIQGIGAGFKPEILNMDIIDEILTISDDDAFKMARLLATEEGILSGISSGAALSGSLELARRLEFRKKNIVMILPDTGERYLSVFKSRSEKANQ